MGKSKLTLQTIEGSRKLIVILMGIILACSFVACLIQTTGGKVKIEEVKFDARGAVQDADLYIPYGTSSKSSLPCVILSHGGGCTKGVMTGFAQELARRGFVVLNVSSYGAGLSDQPMYDEDGYGVERMGVMSQGLWDAVNYVRTLKYVDQTRIAIAGHSQGAYRSGSTAVNDCTYFTLNDMMINFMHETYDIQFTEGEISQDAAALASKYLTTDQIKYYKAAYKENSEYWNTRVKAVVPIGSTGKNVTTALAPATVKIAGHEVTRFLQTNICLLCGQWDHNYRAFAKDTFSKVYFQTGDKLLVETWMQPNSSGTAKILGPLNGSSIVNDSALHSAIEARSTRMVITPSRVSHSLEFLSNKTTAVFVKYIEQVLDYNNGPLTSANKALTADNIVWQWREYLNTAAMLAMIGLSMALVALSIKQPYFASIDVVHTDPEYAPILKRQSVIFWIISVAICAVACYLSNNMKATVLPANTFLPLDKTAAFTYTYIFYASLGLLLLLAAFALINKKQSGNTGLKKLGIDIAFGKILKSLLLACVVIVCCYASLILIEYLFGQDYRWWMCVFTEMKLIHWAQAVRYFVFLFPAFLVICSAINYTYTNDSKLNPTVDMILTVIVGSLGVFINNWVNLIGLYSTTAPFTVTLISQASIAGALLLFVPITVYIARKTYKLTGSVWTGTFLNALLAAWAWTSAISSTNVYMGTTFLQQFLGF